VDLDFLFEILDSRGFCHTWINWIRALITGGYVGVALNGSDSQFFKTEKGLRLGIQYLLCCLTW
jgi:hypothetical protein